MLYLAFGYTTPVGLRASTVYGATAAATAGKLMDLDEPRLAAALAAKSSPAPRFTLCGCA